MIAFLFPGNLPAGLSRALWPERAKGRPGGRPVILPKKEVSEVVKA